MTVFIKSQFCRNIKLYFREYCSCTSIHGFQYLGEAKRNLVERLWWLTVFFTCLGVCIFAIHGVYVKWEFSPVIVNFANKQTPIYNIPFPAVTICPESKAAQSKFNYTEMMRKRENRMILNFTDNKYFEYMSLLCTHKSKLNITGRSTVSEDFYEVIEDLKPNFQIYDCEYVMDIDSCQNLLTPIITDEGICYTFNILDRSTMFTENVKHYKNFHEIVKQDAQWSIDEGYSEDAGINAYPFRALLAGAKFGLSLTLITKTEDLDFACNGALQGYKVLLHAPMTMPRPSQKFFRLPLNQSVFGAIQPVAMTTSPRVKNYKPSRRECYFPSERSLKYFKIYTSTNCQLECLTNYTLHECGCVNYFMPRSNGTKICGRSNMTCMEKAAKMIEISYLYEKIEQFKFENGCDCSPLCSDLTYEVETSQSDWNWELMVNAQQDKQRTEGIHMSSLTLFFKSNHFITSERNELYGPLDFLANIGGLLGLFTGFSILSLMEIIYFLSLRIIYNKRMYGQCAKPEN